VDRRHPAAGRRRGSRLTECVTARPAPCDVTPGWLAVGAAGSQSSVTPEGQGQARRYVRVRWDHALTDEPSVVVAELDARGCEVRKVEQYADGRRDLAGRGWETGSSFLSLDPWPSLDRINASDEFAAEEIPKSDFEALWRSAEEWFDDR